MIVLVQDWTQLPTQDFLTGNNIPFKLTEFRCKCGRPGCATSHNNMQPSTFWRVITARLAADMPFVITSAFRCEPHNDTPVAQGGAGGSKNSAHKRGHAVDIRFRSSHEAYKLLTALLGAGFTRIGINFKLAFIHADDDPSLPPEVVFKYD